MDTSLWSDDRFRSFFAALRGDFFGSDSDAFERDEFLIQARLRVAPAVQQTLLADIGVTSDAAGIAQVALDVLDEQSWGKRRSWLLVTTDPWSMLAVLVHREIRSSYRASVRGSAKKGDLDGIARASTRPALPPGSGPAGD